MVTKQLSEKNPYFVNKERQLELEHFCRQYPNWVLERRDCLSGKDIKLSGGYLTILRKCTKNDIADKTAAAALYVYELEDKMSMIDDCLDIAVVVNLDHLLKSQVDLLKKALFANITSGMSYDDYFVLETAPISRHKFYQIRRIFFWLLDQKRG